MMKYIIVLYLAVASHMVCTQYAFTCIPEDDCKLDDGSDDKLMPDAVPDSVNCHNFFACDDGISMGVSLTCGEDKIFDGEMNPQQCKDILTEPCISICSDRDEGVQCSSSCGEVPALGNIAVRNKCNEYYTCGNSLIHRTCTGDNAFFDGTECVEEEELSCCQRICNSVSNIPSCNDITEFTKIPDPDNCGNFYLCLDDTAMIQSCHIAGDIFDIYDNECKSEGICGSHCTGIINNEKSHLQKHSYENPICIDVSSLECPSDGNFPICFTCKQNYVKCENSQVEFITCPDGEYFPPGVGFSECMPMNECRALEDRLFDIKTK